MSIERRSGGASLDAIDLRLLTALDINARLPLAELARRVEMSPQSVSERLKRLEDAGVIAGFSVKLDPKALGLSIGAYIRVRPMIGELQRVAEILRSIPEIVECDRITGDDCFIAKALVRDIAALEQVIDRLIPHAQTNTSIIQSSPVPRRAPRLR
jgi:Lrp/AsnC family transcriptional regulator, leucine-responsive regulatory protein